MPLTMKPLNKCTKKKKERKKSYKNIHAKKKDNKKIMHNSGTNKDFKEGVRHHLD